MPLIPYDPFKQFQSLEQAIEGFFKQVSAEFGGFAPYGPQRVQVMEADAEVIVHMEVQGIEKKEDVLFELQDGHLLLMKGSTQSIMENTQGQVQQYSSCAQSFQRVVPLPTKVRVEGATTMLHNGVLTIRLPKRN